MMKNLLQIPKNAKTGLLALLLGAVMVSACSEDKDYSRSKKLLVFADPADQQAVDEIICPTSGGIDTIYVRTNVECKFLFRTSNEEKAWIKLEKLGYDTALDAQPYRIYADPMNNETLVKRTGTLSIVFAEEYLGQFIVCRQGFDTRISEKFDWLNTGTDIPYETTGEKLLETWTEAQREKGWKAPLVGSNPSSYLYNKRGYIKLGDGQHAMNLQLPDLAKMTSDSIVLLSFKAVAYVGVEGDKDNNKLSVKVENGGMFRNSKKSFDLELGHYNPADPDLTVNMWKACTYKAYLFTDKDEKFTSDTKITLSIPEGANRVFIDDVYIYIIDKKSLDFVDLGEDNLSKVNQQ